MQPDQAIQHRPKQITYLPREGGPSLRLIRFEYEDRPDPISEFVGGVNVVETKRLSSIEMIGPAPVEPAVLRSYRLRYVPDGGIGGRSLLFTITECDGQDKCKAPISFGWELGSQTFTETSFPFPFNTLTLQAVDLNNDGFQDLLFLAAYPPEPSWSYMLSDGTGFAAPVTTNLPLGRCCGERGTPNALIADLDADGVPEIGIFDEPTNGYVFYRQTGEGTFAAVPAALPPYLGDMNGDGLPDMMSRDNKTKAWGVLVNNRLMPGNFPPSDLSVVLNTPDISNSYFADIDGDARLEFLFATIGSNRLSALNAPDSQLGAPSLRKTSLLSSHDPGGSRYLFLDANGDGLTDAFRFGSRGGAEFLLVNSGNGFFDGSGSFPSPFSVRSVLNIYGAPADNGLRVVDFNQDGREELLSLAGTSEYPYSAYLVKFDDFGRPAFTRLPIAPATRDEAGRNFLGQTLDMDGDGLPEIIEYRGDKTLRLYRLNSKRADLMTSVVDRLGA